MSAWATPTPTPVTYITPGVGSFSDASGNVYTLTVDGSAQENGVSIPGGYGTAAMDYYNSAVYGQDAATMTWYIWDGSMWTAASPPGNLTPTPTPTPSPTPTPTPTPTPPGSNFSIRSGSVFGLDGNPFTAKGVCMTDTSIVTASQIITTIPHINVVNLALGAESGGGYTTCMNNASIYSWVDDAVSRGLNVILSDYVAGQPGPRSGGDLTNMANWYGTLAAHYAGNPHVWWTTSNEIAGNTDAMWTATYNAIRGAGNNSLILLEFPWGNIGTNYDTTPSIVSGWTNVCLNVHSYELAGVSTLAQADSTKAAQIAASQAGFTSLDGILPVFMGEGGNASAGTSSPPADPFVNGVFIGTQATDDLCLNTAGAIWGYTMWCWAYGGPNPANYYGTADNIIAAGSTTYALSTYGQQIANNIAARQPGG